jgi:glucose/arabinose dehydrogenase
LLSAGGAAVLAASQAVKGAAVVASNAAIATAMAAPSALAGAALPTAAEAAAPPGIAVSSGFAATEIVSGLRSPTAMAIAADGRIFVCEQKGTLRVIRDGQLLAAPFVTVPVDGRRERGLVGVALHPDFPRTPYVYVYYTAFKPTVHNRLSRYTANGDRALAGSERVLVDFPPLLRDIHNGGALHFGADGKLYVGVGEGGVSTNAQSLQTPLGKLLRFDDDGGIPADNPFYAHASGLARATWALGLRNPFTFAFDRTSARLFVNDVGFRDWEEINEIVPGGNYGWPLTEGPTDDPAFRSPLFAYAHGPSAETGCAIAGAAFYDHRQPPGGPPPADPPFPATHFGSYFFADFCSGWVRRLDPTAGNAVSAFASGIDGPVDLRVGPDGALYYLAYGFRRGVGAVGRIVYTATDAPSIAAQPQAQRVAAGAPATFRVEATGAAPLAHQWRRDGAPIAGASAATYTLAAAAVADDGARFSVVVSNAAGSATSNEALLTVVAGQAPTLAIAAPAAGTTYAGGDTIAYAGTATDAEDGPLPPSAFTWRVDFHHADHLHPYAPPTSGAASGSFAAFTGGETAADVWFRIHLEVADSSGLTAAAFVDVLPRTARFTLATVPAGLQVTLDGTPRSSPLTELGVAGVQRTIGAPSPQVVGGTRYELVSWSDGGAPTHTLATPAVDTTYVATFRAVTESHGLLATYFAGDFARPLLVRVDPQLDFQWRSGRPAPGLPADGFSVRWRGELEAPASGTFVFHLRSDDGARLRLDGRLLIDDWGPHGERTRRATAELVAGRRYPLVVEAHDESGPAALRLLWSGPGVPREVVPAARLFPAAAPR